LVDLKALPSILSRASLRESPPCALRTTPSYRRFAGLDRRARLADKRNRPFEAAFSFLYVRHVEIARGVEGEALQALRIAGGPVAEVVGIGLA
jgi:hypothetical protein